MIAFLLQGKLPWSGADHRDHLEVSRIKSTSTNLELFGDQQELYGAILEHARKLEIHEIPNYDFLRTLFN